MDTLNMDILKNDFYQLILNAQNNIIHRQETIDRFENGDIKKEEYQHSPSVAQEYINSKNYIEIERENIDQIEKYFEELFNEKMTIIKYR